MAFSSANIRVTFISAHRVGGVFLLLAAAEQSGLWRLAQGHLEAGRPKEEEESVSPSLCSSRRSQLLLGLKLTTPRSQAHLPNHQASAAAAARAPLAQSFHSAGTKCCITVNGQSTSDSSPLHPNTVLSVSTEVMAPVHFHA